MDKKETLREVGFVLNSPRGTKNLWVQVQEALTRKGKTLGRSQIFELMKKYRNNYPIDQPVDWHGYSIMDELGIARSNKPKIRLSTTFLGSILSGEITIAPPETFRYVKWANYVLDYTGGDMPTYMDLWVIASVFERRDAIGVDMADLEAWLTYRPYRGGIAEYDYLDAVSKGNIPMLNTGNLFQKQDKRIKGSKDMYKQWSKLHLWSNKDHISELLFTMAEGLNIFFGAVLPPDIFEPLKAYNLPSQNLFEHGAWVLDNHLEEDEVMEFGDPKGFLYRIDLREYVVEVKELTEESVVHPDDSAFVNSSHPYGDLYKYHSMTMQRDQG